MARNKILLALLIVLTVTVLLLIGCATTTTPNPSPTPKPSIATSIPSPTPTTANKPSTTIIPTPTIITSPLEALGFSNAESAILNQNYVIQLPAAGGLSPYTWTFVSGNLPTGLTLNSNGQITGIPTSTGSFTFHLKLSDAQGKSVDGNYTLTVIESGTLRFVVSLSPYLPYNENQVVGYVPLVQGGKQPWNFAISGLPSGLTFDPATGLIHGKTSTADVLPLIISVKDADGKEAIGSPMMVNCLIKPPKPTNIVSGKSVYDGTYTGIFSYTYEDESNPPKTIAGGFRLIIKLAYLGTANGVTALQITYASCSDPFFGCQIGGCTPNIGSVATLPAEPPTGPFNESQAGMGIAILFPNGATLVTNNIAGAINVGYNGWLLSNSLIPEIKNQTWSAASVNNASFLPQARSMKFTSWSLSWSNVDW